MVVMGGVRECENDGFHQDCPEAEWNLAGCGGVTNDWEQVSAMRMHAISP